VIEVIDEATGGTGLGEDAEMGYGRRPHGHVEQRMVVIEHRLASVQDEQDAMRKEMKLNQDKNDKYAAITHKMLRRVNQIPFTPRQRKRKRTDTSGDDDDGGSEADEADDVNNGQIQNHQLSDNATLSKTPRDLFALWEEYDKGVDGRKAARLFTPQERSQSKYTYCRRNVIWQLISRIINHTGYDYRSAIEKIYEVYGYESLTKLQKKILADEQAGGHANLYPDPERARKRRRGRNS
jgi:hypothetical protein